MASDDERISTLVRDLALEPHPEGGWYKRVYTSATTFEASRGSRVAASMILYLLPAAGRCTLHELHSDEIWLWQAGGALEVHELHAPPAEGADAVSRCTRIASGCLPYAVPARSVFGVSCSQGWALVACVVVPGFDWADWGHPSRAALSARFPGEAAARVIAALGREGE